MGITIQPNQPAAARSDDDSMGDSSPSRSGSPVREAVPGSAAHAHAQEQAHQSPAHVFAVAAAAAPALPAQQAVLTPQRVSMLRGGPVAGAYIDGRYSCLVV